MPNKKNLEQVKMLREKIQKAKSVVFVDYQGLSSNKANEFRDKISEQNADVTIARNTLFKIALTEEGYNTEKLTEGLDGQNAAIFAYEDAVSPLKAIVDFAKKLELPKLKVGFIDGIFADAAKLQILSDLPSKEQLLAQVVGGLKSPLSGFVNVLGGPQRNLVYALNAIKEKKEGGVK